MGRYKKNSLTLTGAVVVGRGVMIGADDRHLHLPDAEAVCLSIEEIGIDD